MSLSQTVRRVSQKKGEEEEMGRVSEPETGRWGDWEMGRLGDGGEFSLDPRTSSLNIQSVKSVKSRFTARCRTSFFLILKYGESFQRVNN
ncbi:hypothetical protein AVDCRST_MAG84-7277 [uncultured Microcoleus sp.]|uniref:Uncharacterized protein n=1 Tax=uncultured Microcoleus sp. TaxID=259945 RepID=A0A6J4PQP8_9CYAN|nr:hypothetical protein AVDCRST_MAG84-7277 [uncultured Microcoleus sp.]